MDTVPLLNSLLVVLALILVYWVVDKISGRRSLPPGPPGWPIIGNLLDMPKNFEWIKYKDLSERYTSQDSDIIYLNVLGTSIVVLNSLKAINDLLEGRASIYSDRPTSIMITELMGWHRALPFMPYGEVWRSQRRAFHREFQPQAVSRYHPKQIKVTHSLLRRLLASPQRWYEHIHQEAGAAIMDITYGIEVLPENDPYIQTAEAAVNSLHTASTPGAFLVDVFPLLKFMPEWAPGGGFQRKAGEWKRLLEDVIEVPYAAWKNQMADGVAKPSFVSRSISLIDATGNLEKQENIIRDTAGMVYAGGSDTISSATNTFMLAMLTHPEVRVRAQAELDMVIGKGQLPTFADRESLPYITAVVKETLRWEPTAPVSIPRQVRENDEYKGYYIPKGSVIMVNSWAVLHDEKMYPDPFAFKPERFIKDGRLDPAVQEPEVAAFGYARRICPGKSLGFDSVWLNVASILAAFDINEVSNSLNGNVVEPEFLATGLTCRPNKFTCDITPRSKEITELIQATAHMD